VGCGCPWVDSQYLTGSGLPGAIRRSAILGQAAVSGAGDVPVGGRTRMARKCERIAAVGLSLVFLLPLRQVTGGRLHVLRPEASSRRVTGSSGLARLGAGGSASGRWRGGRRVAGWAVRSDRPAGRRPARVQ